MVKKQNPEKHQEENNTKPLFTGDYKRDSAISNYEATAYAVEYIYEKIASKIHGNRKKDQNK